MSLTTQSKHAVNARYQADPALALVTLEHDDWSQPIRLVEDDSPVTSRGNVFAIAQATVGLPTESDLASRGSLVIDNVNSEFTGFILAVGPTIKVTVEIVMASAPDTVLKAYTNLNFENIEITNRQVAGQLIREDYEQELWPPRMMNIDDFRATGW